MASWSEDIITVLKNLGGVAKLPEIYEEIKKVRNEPLPKHFKAAIRNTIEDNSSDSKKFKGNDLFFSARGIGKGIWGLRSYIKKTPEASDLEGNHSPDRTKQEIYTILRDTYLARQIKLLHKNKCQLCSNTISLNNSESYSEAHHIKPLGNPHNGPDIAGNILVLCPNHHVMLDYGVIELHLKDIREQESHKINNEFINYHNNNIFQRR